ncbi:MAG: HAD-IIIA family hydrolase [Phycisphaeraceae bacterium]|nr:MAG: HAD-IIIA family hydrolase [Phycisphaeraceae bacterium]
MRLGHVTDLHARTHMPGVAPKPGRLSRDIPDRLAQCLARMTELGCDAVAVTGDLLDVPTFLYDPVPGFKPDEPAFWAERAEMDYRLIRGVLEAAGLPFFVLPGNHDFEPAMWRVFNPEANEHEISGVRIIRFCDREHHIGASGHTPRRFYPERDRWLEALADATTPQVHLQHYVIAPTIGHRYPHNYAEHEEMTRRISAAPHVRLCLSGHDHNPPPPEVHGSTLFAVTPSFCEHPHRFRVFDVKPGAPVTWEDHALAEKRAVRPCVFLDRDGVLNHDASFWFGPDRFELLPGVGPAVRRLNEAGFATVVQTRQSCVGTGFAPYEVVRHVHDKMHRLLGADDARLDAVYFSMGGGDDAVLPMYRDVSDAKPSPKLLVKAASELGLDLGASWMVGDSTRDIEAGARAGCRTVLVRTGDGPRHEAEVRERFPESAIVADLPAAVGHILSAAPGVLPTSPS